MSTIKPTGDPKVGAGIKGVRFVTDTEGNKVAVMLDLAEWGELWEDIYDNMIADQRAGESGKSLESFEDELRAEGLLNE
jgi:hypothetical protein